MASHAPSAAQPLQAGEVHLWLVVPSEVPPSLRTAWASSLCPEESARLRRFRFEADRALFVTAHGLLRQVLGLLLDAAPASLRFLHQPGGKPVLGGGGLHFNVSHTEGLVALAVAKEAVGVDVERFASLVDPSGIAAQVFSAEERSQFEALAPADRSERFARLWTLKEAYVKGTGEGLGARLDTLTCDVGRLELRRAGSAAREPWALATLRPSDVHWGAVALETALPLRILRHSL